MTSAPPVTPLHPHRGQHAGGIALGLLAATTAVVWTTSRTDRTAVEPRQQPAAAAIATRIPETAALPPLELGTGVGTWVVGDRELSRVVGGRAPVTFDEHRTHHVRVPVAGWFEKARGSSLGRIVRAGETIGTVYSPEVYLTTVSLLAELRDFKSQEAVDAQRIRLLRWGMRQEQVTQIETANKPSAELPIIARVTGKVVFEQGRAKQLIDPSIGDVFTITDPAYATIYVDIPVADADQLALGARGRVVIDGSATLVAPVGYISRSVERGNKTVRVDLNPYTGRMPPSAEAMVELAYKPARGLAVPEAAVTQKDEHTIVYVARAGGEVADPRIVTLGPADGGFVLVTSGLAAGETVALPPR